MQHNKRRLWGVTSTSVDVVKIYVDPNLPNAAETDGATITLRDDQFLCPLALDETLMHEFVHVLEWHFRAELRLPDPKHCTQLARIFGRELPRMLRQLKQVEK